jgi:ABC-2 type transport system ATP-binding protein
MPDRADAVFVSHLSKSYRVPALVPWKAPTVKEALRDVSFRCADGRITCLLGANGSGKTTTIKVLAGLVEPERGVVAVRGIRVRDGSEAIRAGVGFVASSERSFYWRLTGRQNLDFFASLHGIKGRIRAHTVHQVMQMTGIDDQADKPVRLYSSGMRQKLLLARALLGEPKVLLLDEPTTHLDYAARSSIHRLIRDEIVGRRGMSVLLSTNDLQEAQELGDSLVLLHEGVILAEGPLETLRSRLRTRFSLLLSFERLPGPGWEKDLGITVSRAREDRLECLVPTRAIIPDVVAAALRGGGRLSGCSCVEPALSDVLEQMTGMRM